MSNTDLQPATVKMCYGRTAKFNCPAGSKLALMSAKLGQRNQKVCELSELATCKKAGTYMQFLQKKCLGESECDYRAGCLLESKCDYTGEHSEHESCVTVDVTYVCASTSGKILLHPRYVESLAIIDYSKLSF